MFSKGYHFIISSKGLIIVIVHFWNLLIIFF